ncbi:copper amine oxidase N-terminal domain-containing protein [Cytobacillus depressus]|uniref:Copper amine oxidase N-terminal domain-containing protein n=2 Tax=Cytobacillus depressus TaxID=1602942 RepID=A0A6L3V7Z9_9BACI|nr:copper amine oxidase N-terminal domain-containing protein [Cytobacillus depressus]
MSFSAGVYAAPSIKLIVNGSQVKNAEAKIINSTTYVPLRAISEMLGATVNWDNNTKTVTIVDKKNNNTAPTNMSQTINGVTVTIDRVVQDSDSLKIYVTYVNRTNKEVMTGDSLAKIVSNGKQYSFDSDFNFERWYEKDVPHADYFIEPGVSEQSVIFFKPVSSDTINIVLSADFENYRFNNVKVNK